MKIRIASSIALAAALALGATGCSLIAPQGTSEPYSPSDGIEVDVAGVDIRNMLLIADETGESFNVVFSTVNRTGEELDLAINFIGPGSESTRAEVSVPTGSTAFGDPETPEQLVQVALPEVEPGATVEAYFQTAGNPEVVHDVPVLDGTLAEYEPYVLSGDDLLIDDTKVIEDELAEEDAAAGESKIGDDATEEDANSAESESESGAEAEAEESHSE